jgi:hypothetical protein
MAVAGIASGTNTPISEAVLPFGTGFINQIEILFHATFPDLSLCGRGVGAANVSRGSVCPACRQWRAHCI